MSLTAEEVIATFRAYSRKTLRFQTVECRSAPPMHTSGTRVGGWPYMEKDEPWPTDKHERAMHFGFQLDFRGHEKELSFALPFGLLTLFYPHNGSPFRDSGRVIRTYAEPREELAQEIELDDWDDEDCWIEMVDPCAFDDVPDFEDLEFLSQKVGAIQLRIEDVHANYSTKIYEVFREELKMKDETRLGGFPRWLNGYQRPLCPQCNELMFQLVQMDQLDMHNHYLGAGACGFGHLFFCPTHPSEFTTCVSPLS